MLFHDLLNLDDTPLHVIERSFSDQSRCELTEQYLSEIVQSKTQFDCAIQITDQNQDELTGIALLMNSEGEDFWAIFSNVIRKNPGWNDLAIELCERVNDLRVVAIENSRFMDAITEYYSLMLVNRMLCDRCMHEKKSFGEIFSESRVERLLPLLTATEQSEKIDFKEMDLLEICCGNGMATIALRAAGCDPLCLDSDQCAVCEGLEHGVLAPHRSMVLDATLSTRFFAAGSFDCVVGFMLGAIYPFNRDLWEKIMRESATVLRHGGVLLVTVHKNEEIVILKEILDGLGISGEIIDNRDDAGLYDQWVYLGEKVA